MTQEDDAVKEMNGIYKFFYNMFRWHTKEVLTAICIILGGFVLIQNISCGYNSKDGFHFEWRPAAKIEISK
jgi:hypothetical protein